jgi:hypothetical protein
MAKPSCFTLLAELKVDWPRVLKRVPFVYRGYLTKLNINELALFSSDYKLPVLALPHSDYIVLNRHVDALNAIASAVNTQLVHKISGIRFVPLLGEAFKETIDNLVRVFDAEIIDIGYND